MKVNDFRHCSYKRSNEYNRCYTCGQYRITHVAQLSPALICHYKYVMLNFFF